MLVSPSGQSVGLFFIRSYATNAVLTFDDAVTNRLGDVPVSGTYQPDGSLDSLASPAPLSPYGARMADVAGGNPNGSWSLYLNEGFPYPAELTGGWVLNVQTEIPAMRFGVSRTNGAVALDLKGSLVQKVVIKATINLAQPNSWISLTNFDLGTNAFRFTDPQATTHPQRFYRSRFGP